MKTEEGRPALTNECEIRTAFLVAFRDKQLLRVRKLYHIIREELHRAEYAKIRCTP